MAKKHKFSQAQRHAVLKVHGLKCYIGHEPLDYVTAEIDNVIPESLGEKPDELAKAIEELGRPVDFDLNSFENWLPACRKCNGDKLDAPWEPSLKAQGALRRAAAKADDARAAEAELVHKQTITKALNNIARAGEKGQLSPEDLEVLAPLFEDLRSARPEEEADEPIQLTPDVAVQVSSGRWVVVDGPYGRGAGPEHPSDAMRCGVCGYQYFNGVRCVMCGNMDDD